MKPGTITGIHHPSLGTTNYPEVLRFYTRILGLRMVGWYLMHGSKDSYHALLGYSDLRNSGFLSFSNRPEMEPLYPVPGLTTADGHSGHLAAGSAQFYGFGVGSPEDLTKAHEYIASEGFEPTEIIDHGYCQSFYFKGPEQTNISIMFDPATEDGDWVDQNLAASLGLSREQVQAYRNADPAIAPKDIKNPDFDGSRFSFAESPQTPLLKTLDIKTANFLISDDNPPARGKTMRSRWLNLRKMFAVLPRVLILKFTGKI